MSELVLLDFTDYSLERFTKVQRILQPTEPNMPSKSRSGTSIDSRRAKTRNVSSNVKDPTDRIDFARKVVNSTLKTFDSWKGQESSQTKLLTSKKYVYESASLAFSALYEKKSENKDPFDVEKRHISFVLKLIDAHMVDQAVIELNTIAQSLTFYFNIEIDESTNLLPALLVIPISPQVPESTANVVILSQIALLKAVSKYPKSQTKPIFNKVSELFWL